MLKKETRMFVTRDRRRRYLDTNDWSWRGFEYATSRYGKLKLRDDHVKGVLKYQTKARQMRNGHLALADHAHSKSSSSGSVLRARSHAVRDELEASRIYKESEEQQETETKRSGYRRSKTF